MIEFYFIFYRIPKMMSKLAREQHRSPVIWSLIGIGAWIGAELVVAVTVGVTYAIVAVANNLPGESLKIRALTYVLALAGAILSLWFVRRVLQSLPKPELELPPPPPSFVDLTDEKQNY
jgi:hypothetical protein